VSEFLIRDQFGIKLPDLVSEKLKLFDAEYLKSHGPQQLMIKMKATHAAKITNFNFYVPFRMQDGTSTWLKPYPKPFLPKHFDPDSDQPNDPMGRVVDARFVDTSDNYSLLTKDSLNNVRGLVRDNGREQLFAGIRRLLKYGLLQDKNWEGLGYIELLVKVVDPESIQKILDERILTVSAAAQTDDVICMHCRASLADAACGHKRGQKVELDGINYKNFYIYGAFDYLEVTGTPVPGNQFSTLEVTSETRLRDGLVHSSRQKLSDCLQLASSVWAVSRDEDFMTSLSDINHINVYEVKDQLQEVQDIMAAVNTDKTQTEEQKEDRQLVADLLAKEEKDLLKQVDAFKPESIEEKTFFIRAHSALHSVASWDGVDSLTPAMVKFHAKIHVLADESGFNDSLNWPKDGLDQTLPAQGVKVPKGYAITRDSTAASATEPPAVEPPPVVDAADTSTSADTTTETSESNTDDAETPDFLDSIVAFDAEHITEEVADKLYDLMCEDEEMKDAKLSTKQRKSLKSSTFCGPGRSFPIPDCAHVVAGRRLIGRYKGPGDKSKILACIARKAKALGCDSKKKDAKQTDSFCADDMVQKLTAEQVQVLYDRLVQRLVDERILDEQDCGTCTEFEKRLDELQMNFDSADNEIIQLRTELETAEDNYAETLGLLKDIKVQRINDFLLLKGEEVQDEEELRGLDLQALDSKAEELCSALDMKEIAGRLNSGLANMPTVETHIPDPTEGGAVLADQANPLSAKETEQILTELLRIRMSYGRDAMEAYRLQLIEQGVIPRSLARG